MLVIDCSAVIDVEYTAIKVLEQLDDKLRRNGCELWFAGMTRGVFEVVERSGIGSRIGHERMFLNLQAAVEAYERRGGHESDRRKSSRTRAGSPAPGVTQPRNPRVAPTATGRRPASSRARNTKRSSRSCTSSS